MEPAAEPAWRDPRPDISILAAAGRGNVDGEPAPHSPIQRMTGE